MSHHATTTLQTHPVRHPDQLAAPRREPLPAPTRSPFQPPTRTAQSPEDVRPNDHHWHDQPIPPPAGTTPAGTTTADLAIDWPPAIDWPTVEPEIWADQTDTGFAGYLAKPAVAESAVLETAVEETAVLEAVVEARADWEFTPGDLARWYDEAAARLDAVAGTNFADRPR
ncbi:hypothetical protein [Saccharothrix deserti]|uniref:hypothetical protein n=1 Tax=Saccharothrix deserti TaxID=2593674 RepID=UPI00131C018E|nr:hypothetical protein [Saccharothrix deserti]